MSWPLVKIKDVGRVFTGKTPSKATDEYFGGDIPFVTPAELDGDVYVCTAKQTLNELGAKQIKLLPKDSVMVCCIGSLGKIGIAGRELATNQQINSVVFDEAKVFSKYGFYALSLLRPILEKIAPSTTVPIVNKSNFESLEIPLPPLEEQIRIAAILDKADAIRRKRQQAIKLADDFLRSVFLEMFGDPVTNPKGWEVKLLKEISHIQIGPFGTQLHKEDYVSGGVPLINPTHISGGKLFPNNDLTVSPQKHADLLEYQLQLGDIIMGRRGEMGRCAVIEEEHVNWLCGTGSLFIRPHNPGVVSEYLLAYLSSDYMKGYLESESLGATMPNLNKGIVGDIKVPLPSSSVMEKYAKIRDQIIRLKLKNLAFSKCEFFESLSQKAFSGK